ncbi:N-acyl homoserine lactonase family protein [Pseudonocardia sp. ICBG1034]|uniref:N-acyl homoserine lactonase family protein n=1 Tax=Pseudonocardia sp. ICBG1034 TaxID=2844381 RepID=UPI001CCEF486|nr:N-acyl homoserine lactonase family protein [Pseudonocardia sp. ICBG1034]
MTPVYAVTALRYASREARRGEHFLGFSEDWAEPHPTAYYVWLVRGVGRTILVDAGIDPERPGSLVGSTADLTAPHVLLGEVGVDPAEVDTVVLTHLHYDHTGTVARYPNARFVLQRDELDYWTGPWAKRLTREQWLCSAVDLGFLTDPSTTGRVDLVDGDVELAPGLSVHRVGGHTAGMQIVRVATAAGPVVLASDAAHFAENIELDRAFPIVNSVPHAHAAFDRALELADSPYLVVPGHDPVVLERFPAVSPRLAGRACLIGSVRGAAAG